MSLTLGQTYTAVAGGQTVSFGASGGTAPYTYSVLSVPPGPGGSINPLTGIYTAPVPSSDPGLTFDTIQVVDNVGAKATAQVLVGTPVQLFCDIIQSQMGLAPGRVYLWDQNVPEPTDSGLYVVVSTLREKIFASPGEFDGTNFNQWCNVQAVLGVDIISRGPAARELKEQVLLTLFSQYAERQMEKNCFFIGKLPAGQEFTNLSNIDGAAIPYRFHMDINMQYAVLKTTVVETFGTFPTVSVATNP